MLCWTPLLPRSGRWASCLIQDFSRGPLTMPRLVTPVCNRSGFWLKYADCPCRASQRFERVLAFGALCCLRRSLALSFSVESLPAYADTELLLLDP